MKRSILFRGGSFTAPVGHNLIRAIGWNQATILQTIASVLDSGNGKVLADGERWIYGTYDKWVEIFFPMFTKVTLSRCVLEMEKKGLLISCQPDGSFSRRKYYRLGDRACEQLSLENLEDRIGPIKGTDDRLTGDDPCEQNVAYPCRQIVASNTTLSRVPLNNDINKYNNPYATANKDNKNPSAEDGIFSLSVDETELETEAEPESKSELENLSQHASDKPKQGMKNLPQTQPFPAMGLEGMTQAPRSDSKPKPESFPSQPPKTPEKARRNQLLEHLAGIDGSTLDKITPAGWKVAAKALKEIKAVEGDALTTDMLTRAENAYRKRFPDCRCTPLALAKHWGALVAPQSKTVTASPYRLVTQEDIDSGAFPDQSRPF